VVTIAVSFNGQRQAAQCRPFWLKQLYLVSTAVSERCSLGRGNAVRGSRLLGGYALMLHQHMDEVKILDWRAVVYGSRSF
jgi:hypothetical protein